MEEEGKLIWIFFFVCMYDLGDLFDLFVCHVMVIMMISTKHDVKGSRLVRGDLVFED